MGWCQGFQLLVTTKVCRFGIIILQLDTKYEINLLMCESFSLAYMEKLVASSSSLATFSSSIFSIISSLRALILDSFVLVICYFELFEFVR